MGISSEEFEEGLRNCREYTREVRDSLDRAVVQALEQLENRIRIYCSCAAKGHDQIKFLHKKISKSYGPSLYVFECQRCCLQITKYEEDLTVSECRALAALGLLENPK